MKIDILSVIIGGIVWELLSAYYHFVAKPAIMRMKQKNRNKTDGPKQQPNHYNGTSIGFNCQLKNESKKA